jgi:hypothetical protein
MKDYADEIFRTLKYLQRQPGLEALQQRYPEEWRTVEIELAAAIHDKDKAKLDRLMRPLEGLPKPKERRNPITKQESRALQGKLIRQRMSAIAIERYLKTSLSDPKAPHLKWRDRLIFRVLFFAKGRQRKLVTPWLFRLLWPLVRQRNLLMPMAEARGIYNFYSSGFLKALATEIAGNSCLEIAAGDGYLSRQLTRHGVRIVATDDGSWGDSSGAGKIADAGDVERLAADAAIAKYHPEIVICSWPPANNAFEQHVFADPGVQRYIMIGSEHRRLCGNWPLYQAQQAFTQMRHDGLSAHLYPRDFGGAVFIFDRRKPAG